MVLNQMHTFKAEQPILYYLVAGYKLYIIQSSRKPEESLYIPLD